VKRAKRVVKVEDQDNSDNVAHVASVERHLRTLMADLAALLKVAQRLRLKTVSRHSWAGLTLISRAESKRLNLTFLKKAYPTDILSFPSDARFHKIMKGYIGELMICQALAREQAKSFCHSELDELRVLMVHGVLHLLGYEHEKSKKDAKAMACLEKQILGALQWAKNSSLGPELEKSRRASAGKKSHHLKAKVKGSKEIESLIARSNSIKTIK
jgi:probable rRNA maturation factor